MIGIHFPSLSEYDPFKGAEGTLDPLGLYNIADRLAIRLIPGIRERMSHPRFLTAMAVGSILAQNFEEDYLAADGQSEPYLVYEWHLVEGIIRSRGSDPNLTGLPGTLKSRSCLHDGISLSAARYLKTPTVFGFHGVYRLLANNLDIMRDGILGDNGAELLYTWEKEQRLQGFLSGTNGQGLKRRQQLNSALKDGMAKGAVDRSGGWDGWSFFGNHLFHNEVPKNEREFLKHLLISKNEPSKKQVLEFLTSSQGQSVFNQNKSEKEFHEALSKGVDTDTALLLETINVYEQFARLLQDAFDDCLVAMTDKRGKISPEELSALPSCQDAYKKIPILYEKVSDKLEQFNQLDIFHTSFGSLDDKVPLAEWISLLLLHHVRVQRQKLPNGKNPWFEQFDDGSVVIRTAYKRSKGGRHDGSYVHAYRTNSLQSFAEDLGMVV